MELLILGNCHYRLDQQKYEGSILVSVDDNIPSKLMQVKNSLFISFCVGLNLRCRKWLQLYKYLQLSSKFDMRILEGHWK